MAITRRGREQALRLKAALEESQVYLLHGALLPWDETRRETTLYPGRLRDLVDELFPRVRALVMVCAVGIAVRLVAPHLASKRRDPAVVVVDEQGRYAISLLSGHLGGANQLARRVASILGAEPVITTASDLGGGIAVDLLGQQHGWHLENADRLTGLSAALVNGTPIGVYQDAGERDWWPQDTPVPNNVRRCSSLEELAEAGVEAALVISDRLAPGDLELPACTVVYRPRTLAVGVGCNRGTSVEEISAAVASTLRAHGLARESVGLVASIDLKRDEVGLVSYVGQLGVPLVCFSPTELAGVANLPNPSARVEGHVGSPGVCEPAVLLASGAEKLLVPKTRHGNVTVAVARIEGH